MGKITIKDIAREAGVSVGLVSMTLNGRAGVNPQTSQKIMEGVKRLNYTPNKAASTLRMGYKKTIGVITPDLSNHYFSEVSRQIENLAYENGFTVLFGSSDDRKDKVAKLIETFYSDGVHGILLTPCYGCEEEILNAMELGVKVVLMNRDLEGLEGVGRVLMDNDKAIRMGLDHLLSNGYRHIEMISNDIEISTLKVRENSYLNAMAEKGYGDLARVSYVDEKNQAELEACIKAAHERGADALFIPRGYLALYVCNAIKHLGLRIPEDFAVIGFDGGSTYRIFTPQITQLKQDTGATASESYNMLISMMFSGAEGRNVSLAPSLESADSSRPR